MLEAKEKYFPKTSRVKDEITRIGPKEAKMLYDVQDLVKYINDIFQSEYLKYVENNTFFLGSPLSIYKKHYHKRFNEYIKVYPDADEFEFLKEEHTSIYNLEFHSEEIFQFYKHLYPDPHKKNLSLSALKIRNFLFKRITDLGHFVSIPVPIEIYYDEDTPEWIKERDEWLLQPIRNKRLSDQSFNTASDNSESVGNNTLSALETAYLVYYLVETKRYTFINGTPGELDWKYFSEMTNGTNSDNIRKSYNEIIKTDRRLKASRAEKIKRVISYIEEYFSDNEDTLQLAEEELRIIGKKHL